MTRLRWTEVLLFLCALAAVGWARVARQDDATIVRRLVAERDSSRRAGQRLTTDNAYLRRWARASPAGGSITMQGETLRGEATLIRPADLRHPLVLYSMDPACPSCFANMPYLRQVAHTAACGAQVVGVVAGSEAAMTQFRGADAAFPIIQRASGAVWNALPLAETPVTVVLGPTGRLEGWWSGILSRADQNEIDARVQSACS